MRAFLEQPLRDIDKALKEKGTNTYFRLLKDRHPMKVAAWEQHIKSHKNIRTINTHNTCSKTSSLFIETAVLSIVNEYNCIANSCLETRLLGVDINECDDSAELINAFEETFDVEICDNTAEYEIFKVSDVIDHILTNKTLF